MIPVVLKPEYPEFDRQVRSPGQKFLAENPNPTSRQFKSKNYWSRALPELHAAYAGICAYTAMYLPDRGSVDHYKPKTLFPRLAYEWSNFRLANGKVNSTKGNSADILDPSEIGEDWFFLDVPSCLIRANPNLQKDERVRVNQTINSLRLNDDDTYVEERCNILVAYARRHISIEFLEERYPFIAKEILRQNLQDELRRLFKL